MEEQEEGRYGFGTTIAVDALLKNITACKEGSEILVAINIATLLRNSISTSTYVNGVKVESKENKVFNPQIVVERVKKFMAEIATEISEICEAKFQNRQHHVLFYLTDGSKQIPKEWQRISNSESAIRLMQVVQLFTRSMKSQDQVSKNVTMHVRLAEQMRVPSYKGLAEVLKSFALYTVDLHMISHMPLDYHVTTHSGRKGYLYRSHTGEVVNMIPSELCKTVFKEENVPFYPITHVLFGDKYLLKGSLGKKDKDRLVDIATKDHWKLRTNEYVAYKLKEYNFTPMYVI